MSFTPHRLLLDLWGALVLIWLVGALSTKRVVRRQPVARQLAQRALGATAAILLFVPALHRGWLAWRLFKPNGPMEYAGVAVTLAGMAVAVWARVIIGRNWSANVTVKEDHELIQRGPYAFVRHPIYSGITLAVAGTALAMGGEVRALLALALSFLAWRIKWPVEEQFMIEQFGEQYIEYRRRVKAIIPGIW
jgi:protein-S-isoprenylcysteine O-methyltransferase Ste14